MVALAGRIERAQVRGIGAGRGWLPRRRRQHALQLLEISSAGFHAFADAAPLPGEAISVRFPALGLLDARVTWTREREFRAEFCGASDLRLLFLRKSFVGCSSWFERRSA